MEVLLYRGVGRRTADLERVDWEMMEELDQEGALISIENVMRGSVKVIGPVAIDVALVVQVNVSESFEGEVYLGKGSSETCVAYNCS